MAKVPTQIVIAAYHDEEAADQVADAIKRAKRQHQLSYKNVAVIRKNEKGKVKIKETGDMSGGIGATVGAVAGGALGLLAGPGGLVAGAAAGAVIGGGGAALHDAGIPNERLEQIGDVLNPGNSAVIAIFDQVKVDKATMKEVNKSTVEAVESLAADIGATLKKGQDVAYAFVITEDGVIAERVAVGDEAADVSAFVVTQEGVVASAAAVTEDGVAYEIMAANEDAAVYEAGIVTEEGTAVVTDTAIFEGSAEAEGEEGEAEEK